MLEARENFVTVHVYFGHMYDLFMYQYSMYDKWWSTCEYSSKL